jgi:hypothetical protein
MTCCMIQNFFSRCCLSLPSVMDHHAIMVPIIIFAYRAQTRAKRTSPTDTLVLHPDDRLFLFFRRFVVFVIFTVCNRKDCHVFPALFPKYRAGIAQRCSNLYILIYCLLCQRLCTGHTSLIVPEQPYWNFS